MNELIVHQLCGQWKENTRTGAWRMKGGRRVAKNREEIREEGRWENGKLDESIKYKVVKSELKQRVKEEAIKAATQGRDRAVVAETKVNAAAAKSKIAETRAAEARRHADGASNRVEQTAKKSLRMCAI